MSDREHKTVNDLTGVENYDSDYSETEDNKSWIFDPDEHWFKRWQFWGSSLAAPTSVSTAALVAELVYPDGAVAAVELVTAIASGVVATKSFSSKMPPHLSWGALAMTVAASQAFATTVAGPLAGLIAWGVAGAAGVAARLTYRHNTREDRFARMDRRAKYETARMKQRAAERRQAEADFVPDLIGATPEETDIRRAVWDVFKVSLISCPVAYTRTGWKATVGLPTGLGRKSAKDGWDRVSSALRRNGRFVISNGEFSNDLVVKFLDRNAVATYDIRWTPDKLSDDPKRVSLGIDTETGDPVHLHFDERLLVCGASGTGKSWSTRALLAHAHKYGDVVMIDGKGEEGTAWGSVCRVATEADEINGLVDELHAEMNRRKLDLRGRGLSVWDGDQLTVFIDEGQVVLAGIQADKDESKDRLQRLIELSSLGRSRGIVMWWATQKPVMSGPAPGVHNLIAPNLLQRFSLRVADQQEAQTALDDCAHYGPNLIPDDKGMRGHGYLKGYGPSLIHTWTMDDAAVKSLPRKVWGSVTPQGGATDADKVQRCLTAHPDWSNRAIGSELGFSEFKVRQIRKGLSSTAADPWADTSVDLFKSDTAELLSADRDDQIMAALRANPCVRLADLARAVDTHKQTVKRALDRLMADGLVVRDSDGCFAPVDS